ncbi:MAG: acyl-CoA synthetase, partial [Caulobacter sp.]|nr:acyl-CoA synthetase [Caulobacter sp.]
MDHPTALAMFTAAVARAGDAPCLHYFDTTLTYNQVDRDSDALAAALSSRGFAAGDRLAVQMQSIPPFVIAMIAAWKLGGALTPANPMYRPRELGLILDDATPRALIGEPQLMREVFGQIEEGVHRPDILMAASGLRHLSGPAPRLLTGYDAVLPDGVEDLAAVLTAHAGEAPPERAARPDDIGTIIYTSGTTGLPKGVIATQRGIALAGMGSRRALALPEGGMKLALAPMFHVSGAVMSLAATLDAAATLILSYRFDPPTLVEMIERYRPSVAVGSITAYIAIMNAPEATPAALSGLITPMNGGAPVPAAVVKAWRAKYRTDIRTGYGLTETVGAIFMEPLDQPARVDPDTGTLSVGRPQPGFTVRILDEAGRVLPTGEAGEVVVTGPSVSPGYWRNAEATAESMTPEGFRTGDVGFLDDDGWLFLIDRKKDVIIAGGYKVWPREVEDVLYGHPAVREAAVVPLADAYRGETVRAVVSLRPGASLADGELAAYCRERLAAFKTPRVIDVM